MATNLPDNSTFNWYFVAVVEDIQALIVPQFFKPETVENLNVEVWYSQLLDFGGELRESITVAYNNIYVPVGVDGFSPYYKSGYAVEIFEGSLYLGIEVAA